MKKDWFAVIFLDVLLSVLIWVMTKSVLFVIAKNPDDMTVASAMIILFVVVLGAALFMSAIAPETIQNKLESNVRDVYRSLGIMTILATVAIFLALFLK